MTAFDRAVMLLRMAVRNVGAHRGKSLIIGAILAFGTTLVVVGTALIDAVDAGMRRSVTQSLAGDLQIYSARARDDLALFGDTFLGAPDLGTMPEFAAVAEVVESVPNVAAIVPMGIDGAVVQVGNVFDRRLADLRAAVREGDAEAVAQRRDHLRQMVDLLRRDTAAARGLIAVDDELRRSFVDLERAASDGFWRAFDAAPLEGLEFLDNRVAPLQLEEAMFYLRFVGTDPPDFRARFDRFEVVEGEMIPEGQRGFMFNHGLYERLIKHRVARDFDRIERARDDEARSLDTDDELAVIGDQLVDQYRHIVFQLDPEGIEEVRARLAEHLGRDAGAELAELVRQFLTLDDANFDARRALFYEVIAPHIELYGVPVGSTLTITGFTRRGYVKSVNVRVWGTYRFRGMEKSTVTQVYNLMDLVTFRDLYGLASPERDAEIADMRVRAGVEASDVGRGEVEAALFGGDATLVVEGAAGDFDEFAGGALDAVAERRREAADASYDPAMLRRGPVQNAAILLEDPSRLAQSRAAIERALGDAGHSLRVVTWQEAAGLVGQLVLVMRVVLTIAVLILFGVALIIVNNSMVMATLERTREIGTMRAIGAPRSFTMRLFLLETVVLCLTAGGVGLLLGGGFIAAIGHFGVPASNPYMYFLFSGARLYPTLGAAHLGAAIGLVMTAGVLSTIYPARLAARVPPVVAMASGD